MTKWSARLNRTDDHQQLFHGRFSDHHDHASIEKQQKQGERRNKLYIICFATYVEWFFASLPPKMFSETGWALIHKFPKRQNHKPGNLNGSNEYFSQAFSFQPGPRSFSLATSKAAKGHMSHMEAVFFSWSHPQGPTQGHWNVQEGQFLDPAKPELKRKRATSWILKTHVLEMSCLRFQKASLSCHQMAEDLTNVPVSKVFTKRVFPPNHEKTFELPLQTRFCPGATSAWVCWRSACELHRPALCVLVGWRQMASFWANHRPRASTHPGGYSLRQLPVPGSASHHVKRQTCNESTVHLRFAYGTDSYLLQKIAAWYWNMRWMSIANNCMYCTVRLDTVTPPLNIQALSKSLLANNEGYKRAIGFESDLSYSEEFTYGKLTAMEFYAWLTSDLTDTLRTSGNSLRQAWILVSGRCDEYMWNLERRSHVVHSIDSICNRFPTPEIFEPLNDVSPLFPFPFETSQWKAVVVVGKQ